MRYKRWLTQRIHELESNANIIETKQGIVEYQIRGNAPFLLFFHPGNGGYDQSFLNNHLLEAGFGCISFSRPGYLRTPLSTGKTFAEQADVAAALLEQLNIPTVAVHGASMGGAAAIQFAARHPERTTALLLTSAISTIYPYVFPFWARFMTGSDFGSWLSLLLLKKFPQVVLKEALKLSSTYSKAEVQQEIEKTIDQSEKLDFFYKMTHSTTPAKLRKAGIFNDLKQCDHIKKVPLPLHKITCPTLIVHGDSDGDVTFSHAEYSKQQIANSELLTLKDAYHLVWLSDWAPKMNQAQIEFLQKYHIEQ
ncbi:alpha/beta fold hydrolase [Aureispira anguillae]|uniref:Alpha/beta hydrolase n=1 Tax=Aureispira anguillae TaxID=2864201 RepID=A0A915YDY0_9BACT|nr:alpha/beta hydrolase [Aureispira anguillae]BDS11253.1 alpha/beta hydrolase [Aureispira anguillae]